MHPSKRKPKLRSLSLLLPIQQNSNSYALPPLSAAASEATINWDKETFFQSATFSAIKADVKATSFLSRAWNGEEVLADHGTIQLQLPERNRAESIDSIISHYRFKSYRCEKLDILFGDSEDAPSVKGLHASLQQLPDQSLPGCI